MMTNEQWAEQAEHDFAMDMVDARADEHAEQVEALTDAELFELHADDCELTASEDIYDLM